MTEQSSQCNGEALDSHSIQNIVVQGSAVETQVAGNMSHHMTQMSSQIIVGQSVSIKSKSKDKKQVIRASEAIRVERLDSVIGSTENKNESIKNDSIEDEVRTVPQSSQKIEGSARSTILSHLYKKTTEPLHPGRPI